MGTDETGGDGSGVPAAREERSVESGSPPGRIRLFGTLCGLVFLVNLARVVFAPLLEPLRTTFVLSEGEAGLVATLVWFGSALPRLPTGYLLTFVDRHHVVLGAGVVLAAASAFTATAGSPLALYAGTLAMGLASGSYFIAANPLVSELFPDQVGRAIGIHGTASQLAAAGAPLLVGAVLAVATWRATFWVICAGAVVSTGALFLGARGTDLPDAGESDRDMATAVRAQWHVVLSAIAILGIAGFVWNGVFNFYVTYAVETKGVAEPAARNLLTVVFAAGVPAFWVTGRIADRVPYVPLLLSVLTGFVACLLALTVVGGFWPLVAVSAVLGYVVHSLFPAIDTYLLDTLPDAHRGSAYAAYSAAIMLVMATGSVSVGTLRDLGFGFDPIFRGLAFVLAGILVGLTVLHASGRIPTGRSD